MFPVRGITHNLCHEFEAVSVSLLTHTDSNRATQVCRFQCYNITNETPLVPCVIHDGVQPVSNGDHCSISKTLFELSVE